MRLPDAEPAPVRWCELLYAIRNTSVSVTWITISTRLGEEQPVPRYFFNLHECGSGVTQDTEGSEARDMAEARAMAIDKARAVMATEIGKGRLCLSCWFVIADEQDRTLDVVHFGQAVTLVNDPGHCGVPTWHGDARA